MAYHDRPHITIFRLWDSDTTTRIKEIHNHQWNPASGQKIENLSQSFRSGVVVLEPHSKGFVCGARKSTGRGTVE